MTPAELTQWESNALSAVVPATTIDGSTLYVNYLGYIFAVDLKTGKMLWRSASFHHLEVLGVAAIRPQVDTSRFAIAARANTSGCLARDMKDQNFFAPFQLICRRADNGEIVWKSPDLPDYAPVSTWSACRSWPTASCSSRPRPRQTRCKVRACRSSSCWRSSPTMGKSSGRPRSARFARASNTSSTACATTSPQPRLVYRAGAVYARHARRRAGPARRRIGRTRLGLRLQDRPVSDRDIASFITQAQEPQATGGNPLESGEAFLVKGMQSERLYAVEPNRMKVLWERPITKASRLLGVDDSAVYLGGAELSAVDLEDRGKLLWATRVPGGSMEGRVLVAARRPLAADVPRHLRARSQVGRRAADLSRQRPGLGGGRPGAHRLLAPGRLQSHDLRLSPPGRRHRGLRPRQNPQRTQGAGSP